MNRLKRFLAVIALVIIGESAYATTAESGGMFSIAIDKRFNDYFHMTLQNHLWLDENFTHMERYQPFVGFKTTLVKKYLYFDALYFYRYQKNSNDNSVNVHRYQLGLSGSYKLPRVAFSGYSRFESNYFFVSADRPYNVCNWRNRLVVTGILKNNDKVAPFCGIEFFNQTNWGSKFNDERGYSNKATKGLERIWLEAGTNYKINKTFTMNFIVREVLAIFNKPEGKKKCSTMFGVGCTITL